MSGGLGARRPLLCLVTDRFRASSNPASHHDVCACLVEQARYAVDAGIDLVQVREREWDAAPLVDLVGQIVGVARGTRTRVVVNDRLDVALAAGAAGVHLRGDSLPPSAVRAIVPPGFLVGRSVHGVEEARLVDASVDYLVAGTVFPTAPKCGAPSCLEAHGLAEIVRAVTAPVLAIGGATIERAGAIAASGAAGLAAIGLFLPATGDPARGCRAGPIAAIVQAIRAKFDA